MTCTTGVWKWNPENGRTRRLRDCCLNRASCKPANSVSPSGYRLRYVEIPVAASTTHVPSCYRRQPDKVYHERSPTPMAPMRGDWRR
ncbi:hypothetical protein BDV33DRAFT_96210 [Aspergillus novoparasiticus]|uniref:Uncharacterized protein n=1 Tax=Aspergillus novoparasiticus TaxID=986946 RepID=A0A5N6F743_9EURO|nr:hypothetical protein BDV33DRAFT_96210 [Aspergillus novoparasiticus]